MNAILRSCIDVKSDFNTHIFHQKFMILGNSVLTGSTNFTDTGVSNNLNHIVIINDAKVANGYKREFKEIQRGIFGKNSVDREEKPRERTMRTGTLLETGLVNARAPECARPHLGSPVCERAALFLSVLLLLHGADMAFANKCVLELEEVLQAYASGGA